jgi:RecB family exonuclease
MVGPYVETLDPDTEPVGIERTVATKTETLTLSGRIDRLDERPSADGTGAGTELVVVDYKTGRRHLTSDDARGSLALAVYAVAAARTLRRICRRVELHHVPSGSVAGFEHTDESLARQLGRVEMAAHESQAADARFRTGLTEAAAAEVFPARPSVACGWCDFRRHCPEGRAASPERQSWDGLAEVTCP